VNHHATPAFWQAYHQLPAHIRRQADRSFDLLKGNHAHASLHLKRVKRYWSVRVGLHYRALGVAQGKDIVWFWIGSHADYDRLIGSQQR